MDEHAKPITDGTSWGPAADRAYQRRHARYALRRDCTLLYRDHSLLGRLHDISLGGAMIELPMNVRYYGAFEGLRLRLDDQVNLPANIAWKRDTRMGLSFGAGAERSTGLLQLIGQLAAASGDGRLRPSAVMDEVTARIAAAGWPGY